SVYIAFKEPVYCPHEAVEGRCSPPLKLPQTPGCSRFRQQPNVCPNAVQPDSHVGRHGLLKRVEFMKVAQQEDTQAITVADLVNRYPRAQHNAVDDVSFSVRRGETFGLLGPNGAGKTTTIGILTTLVRPNGGRVTISGIDVAANTIGAKQRIAVVPQRNNL